MLVLRSRRKRRMSDQAVMTGSTGIISEKFTPYRPTIQPVILGEPLSPLAAEVAASAKSDEISPPPIPSVRIFL